MKSCLTTSNVTNQTESNSAGAATETLEMDNAFAMGIALHPLTFEDTFVEEQRSMTISFGAAPLSRVRWPILNLPWCGDIRFWLGEVGHIVFASVYAVNIIQPGSTCMYIICKVENKLVLRPHQSNSQNPVSFQPTIQVIFLTMNRG